MNSSPPPPDSETLKWLEQCRRRWPFSPGPARVVLGFDGFLDRVREMVADRESPTSYQKIRTLKGVEERLHDSTQANSSCTFEWTQLSLRTGGHTVNVGRALRALDYELTLVGSFGRPPRDPFREEFPDVRLVSIEDPGHTDAVEFEDGKLLLADTRRIPLLNWETLRQRVSLDRWVELLDGADLLGMGYWSIIPALPSIWEGFLESVWPRCSSPPSTVLIDPADIRQVPREQIQNGISALRDLSAHTRVIVSANRPETRWLASLSDQGVESELPLTDSARRARQALGVPVFVCHTVDGAVWDDSNQTFRIQSPRTFEPELTTGAGDVFAAGLIAAELEGLTPGPSLLLGSALAGCFVRRGTPPDPRQLQDFMNQFESLFDDSGTE